MADNSRENGDGPPKGGSLTRASKRTRSLSPEREATTTTTTTASSSTSTSSRHEGSDSLCPQQQQQQPQHQSQPKDNNNDNGDTDTRVTKRAKTTHNNSTPNVDEDGSTVDTALNDGMDVVNTEDASPPRPRLSWHDALKEGDIIDVRRTLDES
eukprot:TRINITY_DN1420_c0_g1_i1.p1 TRINITY_DN1420_c0_g1~~TRINITY_DN1420_c0_g1_i1.p1  ORF type:complete len:154 (+),score=50.64 TRINITY_DN1420_c0_g1_i1:176-637(+)